MAHWSRLCLVCSFPNCVPQSPPTKLRKLVIQDGIINLDRSKIERASKHLYFSIEIALYKITILELLYSKLDIKMILRNSQNNSKGSNFDESSSKMI